MRIAIVGAGKIGTTLGEIWSRAGHDVVSTFARDQAALDLVLRKRQDKTRAFFDDMAGRLGREYVPGRSWKSIAEALLLLLPPLVIADLGADRVTKGQSLQKAREAWCWRQSS